MAVDSDSSDDEMEAVVYTCRRCVGVELSKDELEGHRDIHRREKAEKRARALRHRKRGGSPAPSTMTTATSDLFITQTAKSKPGPKSSKMKKSAAEKARRKAAKTKYKKGAEKTMKQKVDGG